MDAVCSKLDGNHIWLIKIGDMSKGPSVACHENKTFGNHEMPQLKGQHMKVVKLMCRDLDDLISKVFLSETQLDCAKLIDKCKWGIVEDYEKKKE